MIDPIAETAVPDRAPARTTRAVRAIVAVSLVAALFYLALAVWAGWHDLLAALERLGWWIAVAALTGVACTIVRFVRWRYLLARCGARRIPVAPALRIYMAGVALTATPAKAGENVRSALLLPWGIPVGTSMGVFVVERLTDLLAVMVVAAGTAALRHWLWLPLSLLAGATILRWWFAHHSARALAARLAHASRLHWLQRLLLHGMGAFVATWRPMPVLLSLSVGVIAYGGQALAFAALVQVLAPATALATSMHVFAVSLLAGAASMLPGGIGVNELTIVALLADEGIPRADAAAAAVGMRIVSFWSGMIIGLACLASFREKATREIQPT